MITTSTGAKKIENTDNWREIFDAHNDSVTAEDKLAPDMAPIVNGNKCAAGAAAGEYVLVRNSSITGITDGAYKAAQAIPANTAIDSTYLTALTSGIANDLNSKIGTVLQLNGNYGVSVFTDSSNRFLVFRLIQNSAGTDYFQIMWHSIDKKMYIMKSINGTETTTATFTGV